MNAYTKLVEVIGQKRAIIDKLAAELAPLDDVLKLLEKDYDEISSLRLQVRTLMKVEHHPLPAPEPERPTVPSPAPEPVPAEPTPAPPAPVKHVTKQQQIFDALTRPMTCGELKAALPEVKSMESTLQVLREKKIVEWENPGARPLLYVRVNGVTGVPKPLPGTTA